MRLWNSASHESPSTSAAPPREELGNGEIVDCRLTPNGRFLLAFQTSIGAAICNGSTGEFQRRITLHPRVAFSDDGTRIVDDAATTWDLTTGRDIDTGCGRKRSDKFCHQRRRPTDRGRVRWQNRACSDAQTGDSISPPFKHTARVIFVAFRNAGNELVTVSADGVIRLWVLDDGSSATPCYPGKSNEWARNRSQQHCCSTNASPHRSGMERHWADFSLRCQ